MTGNVQDTVEALKQELQEAQTLHKRLTLAHETASGTHGELRNTHEALQAEHRLLRSHMQQGKEQNTQLSKQMLELTLQAQAFQVELLAARQHSLIWGGLAGVAALMAFISWQRSPHS